jgi:hypothetical protein
MKKTLYLALSLFVAAFAFSSCDDLTTVTIPFGLSTEHTFVVEGTDMTIHEETNVDLTTNHDFNKNRNKIKEAGVDSLQVRITGHNGPAEQTLTGEVQVGPTATDLTTLAVITGLNVAELQAATADGSWVTLTTTAEGRQRIADLIKVAPHAATLLLHGTSTSIPNFTAHFKIHWSMVAEEDVI